MIKINFNIFLIAVLIKILRIVGEIGPCGTISQYPLLFLVNYVEINDSKHEFGDFNLLSRAWFKKDKLSIINPSHSENQEQWQWAVKCRLELEISWG